MNFGNIFRKPFLFCFLIFVFFLISSFTLSSESKYENSGPSSVSEVEEKKKVIHLNTPEPLKALYMSQCVASTKNLRERLVKLADETEINSLVIDIKDYTGTVSFDIEGTLFGKGCKALDMQEFLDDLHKRGIYTIGRITVFQDPLYTKNYPEFAVKKMSNKNMVWKDRKGLSFVDVGARAFWDYIVSVATSSYAIGFDEINFDYIRYPSDGDMKDIYFSYTGTTTKKEMLREFFEYIDQKVGKEGIVTSADLFGMTTTNTDDLGIGQILEYALLNFDYVAPMVYPSHYPPKFNGWPDPNKVPYEVIKFSMDGAVSRANYLQKEVTGKMYIKNASSSEIQKTQFYNQKLEKRLGPKQLRPWLQDFDYPIPYTVGMVKDQIKATYDVGLTSWMLWDPSNTYTREALQLDVAPARP